MKQAASSAPKAMSASTRYTWMIALLGTQVANVVGSLYLKLAMVTPTPPHPVIFALYREVLTGAALLVLATTVHRTVPRRRDVLRIAGLGLCLFLNQLLYILGLFLAGVTLAACMQPTIPVFTSVLSMICRQEPPSSRRLGGAALAASGAVAMVYGTKAAAAAPTPPPPPTSPDNPLTVPNPDPLPGARRLHHTFTIRSPAAVGVHMHGSSLTATAGSARHLLADAQPGLAADAVGRVADGTVAGTVAAPAAAAAAAPLLGALSLAGNCAAMAGYFVIARNMSGTYPPLALTAWAYAAAAACMATVAVFFVPWSEFVLPACALGPLAYWVLVTSMAGYSILTGATRALPATHVSAFICVQPIAGMLLGWAVLGEPVSAWDCGAALIIAGLLTVVRDDRTPPRMVSMGTAAPVPLSRGLPREDSGEFMGFWLPQHPPRPGRK